MKVLHCADIHLDSPMTTHLSAANARIRKQELLQVFENMATFADKEGASAVIIAGDLFDTNKTPATTKKAVLQIFRQYPEIKWYYLKGNHDKNDFLNTIDEIPDNLFTFDDVWKTYDLSDVVKLSGIEVSAENISHLYSDLLLEKNKFNIVTLHGQESNTNPSDKAVVLNLPALHNQGIDYLALGHIHAYKYEKLDERGFYCYPGCLESRGFDECGKHGFVLLDIDEERRSFTHQLNESPYRSAYNVEVDITGLNSSVEINKKISSDLAAGGYESKDMVEVTLIGEIDYEAEKNTGYIEGLYKDSYFAFKLKDRAQIRVDYEGFRTDKTLKGEFIRTVEADDTLNEEEKAAVIRMGIRAIRGEELE